MPERRADELKKGDVLSIKGERYTVTKAKVHGKHVRLTIDGRRGSFTDDVKARTSYDVIDGGSRHGARAAATDVTERAGSQARDNRRTEAGPLISPTGAQTRWASSNEQRSIVPPAEGESQPWAEMSKTDQRLVDRLGARLVGVEVEGGKLVVPPVDDTTLLGHLATMHGVRYDGATFAEAKAWAKANDPGGDATAEQTMSALTLERARELHATLHLDLTKMNRPHWHREKAPR